MEEIRGRVTKQRRIGEMGSPIHCFPVGTPVTVEGVGFVPINDGPGTPIRHMREFACVDASGTVQFLMEDSVEIV